MRVALNPSATVRSCTRLIARDVKRIVVSNIVQGVFYFTDDVVVAATRGLVNLDQFPNQCLTIGVEVDVLSRGSNNTSF